jgi:hypothetical protein
MRLGIAEIFEKVEAAETTEQRVAILRKNGSEINNTTLATVIRWCMDADTPWHSDLPKSKVEYTPNPFFDQHMMLQQSLRQVPRHFFEGGTPMPAEKRELLWIKFLESIDKDDARVMEAVRLRTTLPYKSITRKLIKEAFPGFLGEEAKA